MRVLIAPIEALGQWREWRGTIACKALVLGKLASGAVYEREAVLRALLLELPALADGLPLFADLSDDYAAYGTAAGTPFLAEYQAALLDNSHIIVPCRALAERIGSRARRGISVVEDPIESAAASPPRFSPGATLRLCWFGNLSTINFGVLANAVLEVAASASELALRLTVVADTKARPLADALSQKVAALHPGFLIAFQEWSLERARAAIEEADLVLLPQELSGAGAVKSHNRLVETIRAGRLALASPIPSYRELEEFAWVGAEFAEGIRWALAHRTEVERRIGAGQAYVEQRFAADVVGRKWMRALRLEPEPRAGDRAGAQGEAPLSAPRGLRLNLGCGDKILPGYVNVDVVEHRSGKRPDVICDLHRLEPFANDSFEEVMAIHVVEHFWRWEVVDVLREWKRVLRPGGRIVLECPNLITACQVLLADPVGAARPDEAGQRSMWVLHGDPRWRDPLMCHRWSYTPDSLREVMEEAGFVNVRREPAQFKLREPRDMRMVGEKPSG
jgi:predicted SAM-dependent methyltransferase